ncbi:MAG: hypothetical protein ACKO6N_12135 [Myxococcota bacterium]
MELAHFLARIHAASADELAEMLRQLLESPEQHLEAFWVFVPEVTMLFSQLLLQQDASGAARLAQALEPLLGHAMSSLSDAQSPLAQLRQEQGQKVSWLLGRLEMMTVLARRLERAAQQSSEGGSSEEQAQRALLRVLLRTGPVSLKLLWGELKEQQPESHETAQALRLRLAILVRQGWVETQTRRGRQLEYVVTSAGRQWYQAGPPWLSHVEAVYRTHRQGLQEPLLPFAAVLRSCFQAVDAETSLEPAS